MEYLTHLEDLVKSGGLPKDLAKTLHAFYFIYGNAAAANGCKPTEFVPLLTRFLDYVAENIQHPFKFEPFHKHLTHPIDYYHFGLDFIRPLVIFNKSTVLHPDNVDRMAEQLSQGDNVVLFANHQTELDPQAISLLLEKTHPRLAEEMIFVAGHRVINDPLAIPFSKGRNLLCIYSKKYISADPQQKQENLLHNQRTMNRMSQLLSEGGKCIYVAPSGGRDRPDKNGHIDVAHFDPQSTEMFWLMAQRAEHVTHFYPLALATYHLLPPPDTINKKLGEARHTTSTPIHLAFGPEIDMEHFPGGDQLDKKQKRTSRAQYIWEQVRKGYQQIYPTQS